MFTLSNYIISDVKNSKPCSDDRLIALYHLREKILLSKNEYRKVGRVLRLPLPKRSSNRIFQLINLKILGQICESITGGFLYQEMNENITEEGELAAEILFMILSDEQYVRDISGKDVQILSDDRLLDSFLAHLFTDQPSQTAKTVEGLTPYPAIFSNLLEPGNWKIRNNAVKILQLLITQSILTRHDLVLKPELISQLTSALNREGDHTYFFNICRTLKKMWGKVGSYGSREHVAQFYNSEGLLIILERFNQWSETGCMNGVSQTPDSACSVTVVIAAMLQLLVLFNETLVQEPFHNTSAYFKSLISPTYLINGVKHKYPYTRDDENFLLQMAIYLCYFSEKYEHKKFQRDLKSASLKFICSMIILHHKYVSTNFLNQKSEESNLADMLMISGEDCSSNSIAVYGCIVEMSLRPDSSTSWKQLIKSTLEPFQTLIASRPDLQEEKFRSTLRFKKLFSPKNEQKETFVAPKNAEVEGNSQVQDTEIAFQTEGNVVVKFL